MKETNATNSRCIFEQAIFNMSSPDHSSKSQGHLSVKQGRSSAEQGQWISALIAYDNALNESDEWQSDPDFLNDRAVALFHNGRATESIDLLSAAINLQPVYGYRFAARGWMRQTVKDLSGAIADYEKALELDPNDAITHNNLGLLEEQIGRMESAKQRFAAADEIDQVLTDNEIPLEKKHLEISPLVRNKAEDAPKNNSPKGRRSAWFEVTKVVTTARGRQEFIDFVRNGFKLNR
tara:strand:- start:9717 stop:10424 length:708 start_codon:yes stop_codon:yes gene_type:complete